MTTRNRFSLPTDSKGLAPDGFIWTGEVQAVNFGAASSAATQITVPGRWFLFYATALCHLLIGDSGIAAATADTEDTCFPVPGGAMIGPFYVPTSFDGSSDGESDLYLRVIQNSAAGVLYIISAFPTEDSRTEGPAA